MNLKALIEKRNAKIVEMQGLVNAAETETRALTQEESTKFTTLETEVRELDATINAIMSAKDLEARDYQQTGEEKSVEETETRAFEAYIRGQVNETRAGEQNLTMGNNGAVIPVTIANKIINTVKDISTVLSRATMYNVKGTLKIPVWGNANTTHNITVGYQEEFTELTADTGKFTSVDLGGYLAGALSLIGKSVINNAQVDIVSFIVTEMARKIAEFLEHELLVGTGSSAAQGIAVGCTNTLTTGSATAITADELITLQAKVKQAYQKDAIWIMSNDVFTAIKKLKDGEGNYLLQTDFTQEFPYKLLGKPVEVSDNMPSIATGNKTIIYGDMSGLSVNMREGISIQLLMEKYATQHAVGVVAWFEFDSKVSDNQKLAVLVQA